MQNTTMKRKTKRQKSIEKHGLLYSNRVCYSTVGYSHIVRVRLFLSKGLDEIAHERIHSSVHMGENAPYRLSNFPTLLAAWSCHC